MKVYNYSVVIEPDEKGYHAYVPALVGCHSFGQTIDEARVNISEAIQLHIESMLEDGEVVPEELEPTFVTKLSVTTA
ncbi:MAG: type II toxin-antitoxin system HicB family antitoxin [Ignavibacteriaceae bacterium]|jgi:predicted RNase H-like HicB family nuclease|nr:type II toxin-antitoxin system HicB family antitoxin [Ignavibacteriaceae bacterium]